MVSPQKIRYNNIFSDDGLNPLDIILDVAFDSDNGATSSYLNRSAVASESHDGRYKNTTRYKYDELFAPQFTIVKKDFSDFTQDEVRKVLKYLTSTDKPALLEVYYDGASNTVDWACIGGFTSIETYKIANNRTVGLVAQFEAITPYAMSDLYGRDADGEPSVYNVTKEVNTTMYYWTSTLVSGDTIPQYILTPVQKPDIGTKVYSVSSAITGSVITVPQIFYGTISKVNTDGSYVINKTTFKLQFQSTKIKRTYDNKITINIDTDDIQPVYPRITIKQNGSVVKLPSDISFNSITDMDNYVENTVYYNESTKIYYYKAYAPAFTSSSILPEYVNWTTTEVERPYTSTDTFAANTFYHYDYEGMYYWKMNGIFYAEPTRPVYGDWKTKTSTKAYTSTDTFEEKTIYSYSGTYYWLAPYTFYKSSTKPNLLTTGVKITNTYKVGQTTKAESMIVKNNTSTEKIMIDGANKIISSTNTRRIFGDDFDWTWLPLYDGKNELTVEGNCEVTLEWREVRKVGAY